MNHPEIISNIFQEELYDVPVKPVVALPTDWQAIRESEIIFLGKILASVKLSLNQVKVITTNKLDVLQWKEHPSQVIAFGLLVPGIGQNEVIEIQDIRMIVTLSLADLERADKDIKTKLSMALKQLFG